METFDKNITILKRLDIFFIIIGLTETFILVFMSSSIIGIVLGLISFIPAYIALNNVKNFNANYFVGIWAILRYNPLSLLAILGFILGDFVKTHKRIVPHESSVNFTPAIILMSCVAIIGLVSFILGILLIIKTSKYSSQLKNELKDSE